MEIIMSNAPTELAIDGMTCGGCSKAVSQALGRVPGVTAVTVDHTTGLATIEGDAPRARLEAAVEAAGFDIRAG